MTTLSTTKPIISCHCSLETFSFFFISSFATAEFRGCSCCEDKNLAGSNQRPFELTQQTMKLCVTSRAILHLMAAQPTRTTITSHPTNDDRSTDHELSSAHPTLDDCSTYRSMDTITAPLPFNNIHL